MSWKPEDRPRRNPEAAFRSYDGEAVVVLPGIAENNVLNEVGSRIFDLLDGNHTVDEIAATISAEFEVERQQADQDVRDFLEELKSHRMLA